MSSECKGCPTYIISARKKECAFTNSGVNSIPNCPCKTCLVKMRCEYVCEELYNVSIQSKDEVTFFNGKPRCLVGTYKIRSKGW